MANQHTKFEVSTYWLKRQHKM